jgi:hypothetical protein
MSPKNAERILSPDKARQVYREAWERWCASNDQEEMARLEKVMDGCQNFIANGPDDPQWREFAASLPGYLEWWEGFRKWGERVAEGLDQLAESPEGPSSDLH